MACSKIYRWFLFLWLLPIGGMILVDSFRGVGAIPPWLPLQLSQAQNLPFNRFPSTPPPSTPSSPTPIPSPLPPPEQLLPPNSPNLLPEENFPSNIPGTITVKHFRFEGNTVFSSSKLSGVIEKFTNRPITFAELLQARTAITQYYVDQGYVTSGAYIPPQTLEKGVVVIRIVEGRLEAINVKVEGKLAPNYIRDRIAIASGPPLNVSRLLESLQLLQLNPIIKGVSAQLEAGTAPGTSILNVTVTVADTFKPEIILDNGRNPRVGSFRRGVQLSDSNLSGLGDKIQGWYLNTEGTNDWDIAYDIPLNARNGTLRFEYRNVTAQVIESPFDVLDITSDYQKYQVSLRQPLIETPNQEFALGLGLDYQESQTRLLGRGFPSQGTNNQGRTNATSLRLFQEWTQRDEKQVIAARSEFSIGIEALGTESFDLGVNPFAPDSDYFIWRGQGQWVRLLAPDTLLVIRGDLQLTNEPLIPLEQFAIGGLGSVVGYRQNYLLTDNGFFGAVEVRFPIYSAPKEKNLLQIVPFINVGSGWNAQNAPNPDPGTLASVGLGLQWQYSDYISARIDWGIKLVPIRLQGDTLQDNGIIFSIIVSPF